MLTRTLLSRLSPLRIGNLRQRLLERVTDSETWHGLGSPQHLRALAVLGRFEALTK